MMAFKVIPFLSVLSDAASPSDTTFMPRKLQGGPNCTKQGFRAFLKTTRQANRAHYKQARLWKCKDGASVCNVGCKDGRKEEGHIECDAAGNYSFKDFTPCVTPTTQAQR